MISKAISPGPLLTDLQFRVSTAYLLGRETLGPACDSLASFSFFFFSHGTGLTSEFNR